MLNLKGVRRRRIFQMGATLLHWPVSLTPDSTITDGSGLWRRVLEKSKSERKSDRKESDMLPVILWIFLMLGRGGGSLEARGKMSAHGNRVVEL